MIIIFNVTDPNGVERRLSAVCAPSTTAAGAINLFRMRVGIPNSVKVGVQLENNIPIRHQTAPLTSLRKQRGGVVQVLQITLWVTYEGPASAMAEINFAKLEEANEAKENGEGGGVEEALEEMGPSWTARGERRHSVVGGTRILKERTTSNVRSGEVDVAGGDAVTETAPQTARRAAPAVSVRIARPLPLTARGPRPAYGLSSTLPLPRQQKTSPQPPVASREERETKCIPNATAPSVREEAHRSEANARASPKGTRSEAKAVKTSVAAAPPSPGERGECQPSAAVPDRGHTVRRDCKLAQIMIREYPQLLDPSESKQIVSVVKDSERLRSMSYDPELHVPSTIEGLSDADYSRYLSIGLVHGIELRSATCGQQIALSGAVHSLKHSCRPNAAVHLDVFTDPYSVSCRCAVLAGLQKGDEITYLYRHADSQAFLLLSRERRQNLLRRRYFFDCHCPRCQIPLLQQQQQQQGGKAGKGAGGPHAKGTECGVLAPACSLPIPQASLDAEATLTGCFFTDSSYDKDSEKQAAISAEMKADFDALQIMSDDGLDITLTVPGNVPPTVRTRQLNKLLHFLRKYASAESILRLHEHHWRVNIVRAAYIQETVRLCAIKGVTPEARRRDPESKKMFTPTRTVFDLCFKQLAVERLFIPTGNPHQLTTYESFLYLVSILPSALADAIMKQARTASRIDWKDLQESKDAWGLLTRTNVSPAVVANAAAVAAARTTTPIAGTPVRHVHPGSDTAAATAGNGASTAATVVVTKPSIHRPPARPVVEKSASGK